jgi:HTH-type transcriptional regulator/antitoxin HigA
MGENRLAARATAPGTILKRELEARGWSQKDLSAIVGRPEKTISAIMQGRKAITPETATGLSAALGTSADFWLNLQTQYDLHGASTQVGQDAIRRRAEIFRILPISELVSRGALPKHDGSAALERDVCSFLGVGSIEEEPRLVANLRQGRAKHVSRPAQVAWLKLIERNADIAHVAAYDGASFTSRLPEMLQLARRAEDTAQVPQRLARLGVCFVAEKPFRDTHLDGAVLYKGRTPVIGLSLRYDRIDNFWFTLMHEVAHVVLDHGRLFADDTHATGMSSGNVEQERAADDWACAKLLPAASYAAFVKRTRPYFSRQTIESFAGDQGVHPGIVLGRLQRDGLVPWQNLRVLLEKVSQHVFTGIPVKSPAKSTDN